MGSCCGTAARAERGEDLHNGDALWVTHSYGDIDHLGGVRTLSSVTSGLTNMICLSQSECFK